MARRTIAAKPARGRKLEVQHAPGGLRTWLEAQAAELDLQWLLAHLDDGVTWGRFDRGGKLTTSAEAAKKHPEVHSLCPEFSEVTLRRLTAFGSTRELRVFRDSGGAFAAALIEDCEAKDADWIEALNEQYLLWGSPVLPLSEGFSLFQEGAQGLLHAPPIPEGAVSEGQEPAITVRHYLNREGFARIAAGRLTGMTGYRKEE